MVYSIWRGSPGSWITDPADARMFPTTANTYGVRSLRISAASSGSFTGGEYGTKEDGSQDDTMYVLYNMHWEPHVFGLPHLPKGQTWHVLYDTSKGPERGVYGEAVALELKDQSQIAMMPRSIVVLCGQPGNGAPEDEGSRSCHAGGPSGPSAI